MSAAPVPTEGVSPTPKGEGYVDHAKGLSSSVNPYSANSRDGVAWREGWRAAAAATPTKG